MLTPSPVPAYAAPEPPPAAGPPPASSRAVRTLVVVVVAGLLVVRLPATLETVRRSMPDDVARSVGDPRLMDLAVEVGALLGLALTLLSLLVFLLLAARLERYLPTRSLGRGRLRSGAFTATVAACYVVAQVRGLLAGPSLDGGAAPVALGLGTGLLVGLVFAWRAREDHTGRGALVRVLATTGLALAMSVTTMSA